MSTEGVRRFLILVAVVPSLLLVASRASPQIETFVQSVRELAAANGQTGPARARQIRAATDRMSSALSEWDRRIAALEDNVKAADGGDEYARHVALGVAYSARGRTTDALHEFDAANFLRPSSSDLQVLRALTLERLELLENGKAVFHAAWILGSNDPVKAYYVVDRSGAPTEDERERARKQLIDAYRRLRTTDSRPSTPPFVVLDSIPDTLTPTPVVGDEATAEAFGLLVSGRYDDAAKALRTEVHAANGGESPAMHFARARDVEAQNRIAEAKSEYAVALRGALTGRSAILVEMGRLSQLEGNLTEAIDTFRHAGRLNPNDPMIHRELAGAYVADGRTNDAFSELVAALLIDPLDAQAFIAIGQLSLDNGQYADATDAFSRALELKPEAFEVRYALATALTRAGKAAEAARQFDMYERLRREALDRRRRDIQNGVDREERARDR